jgi:hypothetical protein
MGFKQLLELLMFAGGVSVAEVGNDGDMKTICSRKGIRAERI